eukprot:TRINITY_DN13335_c0_g1_i1.p1 TRINITY_DN13335_c0_g1~~TRINITY_DN13335_c0_g1_i1.p1  ORF type:complete len:686 (+),score=115.91 TRINITY_DN13335_c0_g1_i1:283-2058(+)
MVRKEVRLLSELDHPHIVKLFEFAEDMFVSQLALILEYIPGGNCMECLNKCVQTKRQFSEALAARVVHQTLLALSYCHARDVVHRDVKPENVMLTLDSQGDIHDCKLIDFGLATVQVTGMREFVGTPAYIAPEVAMKQAGHTTKSDVWSVGVMAFELLTGRAPFGKPAAESEIASVIESIRRYRGFEELWKTSQANGCWIGRSLEAADFLHSILCFKASHRSTAARAVEHCWAKEHKGAYRGLTSEMIRSMSGFASAPRLDRCCLFVLAAELDPSEQEDFGAAFLSLDRDGDGRVSRKDIATALERLVRWWDAQINLDEFFHAADIDQNGTLSHTEFVAACLHGRFQSNHDKLFEQAFAAMDRDRDGFVHANEVPPFFGQLPPQLPRERPFRVDEWLNCIGQMRFQMVEQAPSEYVTSSASLLPACRVLDETACLDRFDFFSRFWCQCADDPNVLGQAGRVKEGELVVDTNEQECPTFKEKSDGNCFSDPQTPEKGIVDYMSNPQTPVRPRSGAKPASLSPPRISSPTYVSRSSKQSPLKPPPPPPPFFEPMFKRRPPKPLGSMIVQSPSKGGAGGGDALSSPAYHSVPCH